jgi:hypothetical protein
MASNFKFSNLEINIDPSAINVKTISPFSVYSIKKEDFVGVHMAEVKVLPREDYNYAFRCVGIGLILLILSLIVGFTMSSGKVNDTAMFFFYLGGILGQLITFGTLILLLMFWDALFGTKITPKMLFKLFGKTQIKVIFATNQNDNLEFYLNPETDKQNLESLMEINKTFK